MPFSRSGRAVPIAFRWWAAIAWTLGWSQTGQAQPADAVDLRWSAPAACPRSEDVQARIRPLLPERSAASPSVKPALVAEGTIVAAKGRYHLTLNVRYGDASGTVTRVFDSEDCASLAGAAAVTLALDARRAAPSGETATPSASAATTPARSSSSTTPLTNAPPGATMAAPTAVPPAPASPGSPTSTAAVLPVISPRPKNDVPRAWSLLFDVPVLAVDQGTLPSFAYGVGVGFGVRARRFRVTLQGVLWLPQNSEAQPFESSYTRRNAALSGCYGWAVGPVDLAPCLALALEDVAASGSGPNVASESGHASWLTVGVAGRAAWSPVAWASLFIRPSVTLATSRPTFAIDGVGSLYQVSWVTVGLDIGCEWIL